MWRMLVAILLFLLSLLVVFRAPTHLFWQIAVAITSFPYLFILLSFVVLCVGCFMERYRMSTIVFSMAAMILYALPVINGYRLNKKISEEINHHFPAESVADQLKEPFRFTKMFSGIGITAVEPQAHVYKQENGQNISLDFYHAASEKAKPCVIVIHGGSWSSGDSKQLHDLNSYLANRGYHVAAIDYRLAPRYQYPAPVEDVKDAMHWLTQHAVQLNIDTTAFILLGRSAGAQIALMAAYTLHMPSIKGVIDYYGPADMVWGAGFKGNNLVMNTGKVFLDYLGASFTDVPEKYYHSSPCEYVSVQSTPTLIIHGETDALVGYQHSVRLERKLDSAHVKHYFLSIPNATHASDYNINGPMGQISTFAVERFIHFLTSK